LQPVLVLVTGGSTQNNTSAVSRQEKCLFARVKTRKFTFSILDVMKTLTELFVAYVEPSVQLEQEGGKGEAAKLASGKNQN
jgi:hypothetical protein